MKKKTYVEVTVHRKPTPIMSRMEFSPVPRQVEYLERYFPFPMELRIEGLDPHQPKHERTAETLARFLDSLHGVRLNASADAYPIRFRHSTAVAHPEGYRLEIRKRACVIRASTATGFFYAAQTLIQILGCAFHTRLILSHADPLEPHADTERFVPELRIDDAPEYAIRSFMIDPGRAPFSMALTKRVIRIMSHLKFNQLHFHAFDDQLCGLRFRNLPLGSENPYAITMNDLAELVQYARSYHVALMPELESWGHAQSVIYHYPETYGGPGMWGGMSFGMGERTYALLGQIYDEVVEVMEPEARIHVGLDEAIWALLPGEAPGSDNPTQMVQRLHDLLQQAAKRHGKRITMHLWADHGGRPLPRKIAQQVVIQPWKYRQSDEQAIIRSLKQYGGRGKTPCMMGAGWSSIHLQGSYEATRIWCREGRQYPNVLGVTNCMWENNDLSGQMLGLYGGACYSWNPDKPANKENDPIFEDVRSWMLRRMRHWQGYFADADPAAIDLDRGYPVASGFYVGGPLLGTPVAPTVLWKKHA